MAEVDGRRVAVTVLVPEPLYRGLARKRKERAAQSGAAGSGTVASPMQGTVLDVKVAEGDTVEAGQVLAIVEAMKMENEVTAPVGGVVETVMVSTGSAVSPGQAMFAIASPA
jgi:biotin carboxyl carrier protein